MSVTQPATKTRQLKLIGTENVIRDWTGLAVTKVHQETLCPEATASTDHSPGR